ncbi:MAG: hypothetical protein U0Q07_11330 [Acidimicrobiales bacterium]
MASTDEYLARYATALQPHVPEPIRAVGILCRPGALGNALVYQASPMVAMIRNRSAKKASGGLPPNLAVAATETRVHLFDYRPTNRGLKVKREVLVLDRSTFQVAFDQPGTLAQRVRFFFADGSQLELDANKTLAKWSDFHTPLFAELARQIMVHPPAWADGPA